MKKLLKNFKFPKIYALIILSLFLISIIPTALAGADTARVKKAATTAAKPTLISTEAGKSDEAPGKAVSTCMQKLLKAKPNLLRNKVQQICVKTQNLQRIRIQKEAKLQNLTEKPAFVKYNKNLEFKARAINKIKLEKARENFLKAKGRFSEARVKYQEAQKKFSQAKSKIQACKESETEECEITREEIKEHAKENLVSIAERILEHLNKLKAKVEANEDLSEEEATEIITKINEQIEEVEEAKATIETSEEKEDIIEAGRTLKRIWSRIKEKVRLHAARTVNARIGGIIVKSEQLEVKLARVLESMAGNGKDTNDIESLIEEFNAKLGEAKTSYEAAVGKFEEAKEATPTDTALIHEGQDSMKSAHEALQEAQKIIRDIIKSIKESDGEEELEEAEAEESEETE